MPSNAYYFNIHKKFSISQLEDFWNEDLNLETANNNEDNTDKVNLDLEPKLSLEKLYGACKVLVEQIQKLSDIPWFL
ncbi:10954_t:CDS:2, partial [Racocetra fulgida]